MEQRTRKLAATLFAAATTAFLAAPLHAVTFNEPGSDAGQTLATASYTGTNSTASLTAINGAFGSAQDADLYYITLTTPGTFSASTVGASNQDTALFLFSLSGTAIATNDDANGGSFQSLLPTGNSLYATLAAGTYVLGISQSGNEPNNASGQRLFAAYPNGDSTAIRGAASGLNPTTLAGFDGFGYDPSFGSYVINLTGAATAVPEPSTWAALATGGIAATFLARRRRQSAGSQA